MSCRTLSPTDEVFGPSVTAPLPGRAAARGEWAAVAVPAQVGQQVTTPVAGVTVRAELTTSGPYPSVSVAVPVGGGVEQSAGYVWAPSGATGVTQLHAVRLVTADFLAIRYTAPPTSVTPRTVSYTFFDLRPPAAGALAPQPVTLGAFDVPTNIEQQFCPNRNGQLALFWRATSAGSPTGRFAEVYRTEINQGVASIQPLLNTDDAAATGTIACRAADDGSGSFTISLHDQAVRQGNLAVGLSAISRELVSATAPPPGKLKLSARTVRFSPGQITAAVHVSNTGSDSLEITAVTSSASAAITASAALGLPICLLPGESIPISIFRTGMAAASATVTITTTPAAAPGTNTVTVTATTVPARAAVSVFPAP